MTRLEELKERLQMYREAERKILGGAEYQIGDRRLRRPDLSVVRAAIQDLENAIATFENPNRGIRRAVFID